MRHQTTPRYQPNGYFITCQVGLTDSQRTQMLVRMQENLLKQQHALSSLETEVEQAENIALEIAMEPFIELARDQLDECWKVYEEMLSSFN